MCTRKYLHEDGEVKRHTIALMWGDDARSEELALKNTRQAMEAAAKRAECLHRRGNGFRRLYEIIT